MKGNDSQLNKLAAPKQVDFDKDSGYLLLRLEKQAFALQGQGVTLEGRRFEPKDEVHITILSREAAEAVRQHLEENPEQGERLRRLIDETHWEFQKLDSFYHVWEEPEAETIIQMVEVPGLPAFFKRVGEMVVKEIEPPPAHVTLYLRNTEKGIGLPTQAVFEQLVQKQVQRSDLEEQ
jgi:hypothetical protein